MSCPLSENNTEVGNLVQVELLLSEPLLVDEVKKTNDPNAGMQLFKLKSKCRDLKLSLQTASTEMFILECFRNGQYDTFSEDYNEMNTFIKQVSELKEKTEQQTTSAEEKSEELEEAYDQMCSNKVRLQELLERVKQKRQQVKEKKMNDGAILQEKVSLAIPEGQDLNGFLESQRAELATVRNHVREMSEEMKKSLGAAEETRQRQSALHSQVDALQNAVQGCQTQQGGDAWAHKHRMEDTLNFVSLHSGVDIMSIQDNTVLLRVKSGAESKQKESLEVLVRFQNDALGRRVLKTVELNSETLDIDHVVKEAVTRNDLPFLLSSLRATWLGHYPLHTEIQALRHRFAIDWVSEQRLMRVLFGSGSTICTLHIATNYPAPGSISLKSLEGRSSQSLDSLQPTKPDLTLTQWVEHLQERFS